jgi:hypothetical protein
VVAIRRDALDGPASSRACSPATIGAVEGPLSSGWIGRFGPAVEIGARVLSRLEGRLVVHGRSFWIPSLSFIRPLFIL